MKKLILLSLMTLFSWKSFSQTDTKNKVVIDTATAKKIAIDLIKGDECKEVLKITNENISLLNKKVVFKDSIISNHKEQIINLNKMIKNKEDLILIGDENLKNTKSQLKKNKFNLLLYKVTTLVSVGVIGALLIN